VVKDITKMFDGQSRDDLLKMREQVNLKAAGDDYWRSVLTQLDVHVARADLAKLHDEMLAKQLKKIEERKAYVRLPRASFCARAR
jgi:hypothetical protein